MSNKNLTYRIGADIGELRREMEAAGKLTRSMKAELAALEAQQQSHRQALGDLGQGFVTYGAVVAAGLAVAGKAAMDWETAFTGVRKTVDGSPQEIAALEAEMRQLARTLPATHAEIAGVAEAAGQLGIKRADIAGFTKVMIDLGNTTNLTAEDAATGLAKLSNIMGTSASDVDRLGSALVALGNDGASTEADILSMALRIAGAGRQVGLTEAQVLGFASALSSVGIEAEAGGSSISRVMITIEQAVRSGGSAVKGFADVAGMSSDAFSKAYRDDAASAIATFIAGLNKMSAAGGDVFGVLSDLGFGEIIVRDAILRTAGASDMLTKSLKVGTTAWAENKALTDEASKRYETSASKLQVAGNQIKDVLIDIGAVIGPMVVGAGQVIGDIVSAFQALPGPMKDIVTWVGVASAGIALFGGIALMAVPKVLAFRESMSTLATTGGVASSALGKFGLFMSGPWGAAIGVGVSLLGVFAAQSGAAGRKQQELETDLRAVAVSLREQNGVVNESIRMSIAKTAQDTKFASNQKGLLTVAKDLGVETGLVTDSILKQGGAYDSLKAHLDKIIAAGADARKAMSSADPTVAGTANKQLAERAAAAEMLKSKVDELTNSFAGQVSIDKEVAGAAKGAAGSTKAQAEQQENLKKQAEEATAALNDLVKALDAINATTLSYREAQRSYLDQIVETNEALATNGKNLDINTKAGRDNLSALDGQAKAANDLAEAAAREAESMGGAAAGAAALKNSLDASRPALIEQAMQFGMNEQQAKDYADAVLGIPGTASTSVLTPGAQAAQLELTRVKDAVLAVPPTKDVNVGVISAEAQQKLRDLGFSVRTLPDGTVVVNANDSPARDRTNTLISDINNRSASLRVNLVRGSNGLGVMVAEAQGGIVAYAGGGIHEDHKPQIVKAVPGMARMWAEPETDKESYIPWAMDRRPRATGVLAETADGFGYTLVPKSQMVAFANGGIHGGAPGGGSWSMQGMTLTGRLRLDGDGFGTLIDARIEHAIGGVARDVQLGGGRP